jgi:hypothetical protein
MKRPPGLRAPAAATWQQAQEEVVKATGSREYCCAELSARTLSICLFLV